mgnify:CR=1 FL=1
MTPYKNALYVVNITLGHNAVVRLNACNVKSCFPFNAVQRLFDDNESDEDQIRVSFAALSVTPTIGKCGRSNKRGNVTFDRCCRYDRTEAPTQAEIYGIDESRIGRDR